MESWLIEEKWQLPHINRVLDYHNKLYGTDFVIVAKSERLFPGLQGGWDWVCCDREAGTKGAIEVKRLTEEYKQEIETVLAGIRDNLVKRLSGKISGVYRLLLTMGDKPLNFGGDKKGKSKKIRELEESLVRTVEDSANIELKGELDLSDKIRQHLPHVVSYDFEASLKRIASGESRLVVELQWSGGGHSVTLEGNQLNKYEALVRKANEQLYKAKVNGVSKTFFVTLDLLYHLAAPPEVIKNTFWKLNSDDHCNIVYAYHVASSVSRIKP